MHASSTAKSLASTSSASTSTSKSATLTTTAAAIDPNCEIEEISKKISEHADAIYRTWKCRGLAPTELLDFYTTTTEAAAMATTDFFSNATSKVSDETTSTEGLQKLVNAFVIKDKEQHKRSSGGRKSATPTAAATTTKAATTKNDKPNDELLTKSSNIMKHAKPATQRPSAILLSDDAPTVTAKKSLTTTMTSSAGSGKVMTREDAAANKSACATKLESTLSNVVVTAAAGAGAGGSTKTRKYAKPEKSAASTALDLEKLELGLNLNLDLGLNLDVQNLTQLQTENLLKIKELLQQESKAAAAVVTPKPKKTTTTTTKIATAVTTTKAPIEQQAHQLQNKQPTAKATTKANDNATTTTSKTKRVTTKAVVAPTTTTSISDNVKIANNITSNNNIAADKNSAVDTFAKKSATTTAIVNAKSNEQKQQISATNSNLNSNANQIEQQKPLKTKSEEKILKANTSKVIKTASSSNKDSSNVVSSNITKTSVDNKSLKVETTQHISASNTRQQQQQEQQIVALTTTPTSPKTNVKAATTNVTAATATSPATAIASSATLLVAASVTMEIARNTMPAAPTKIKTARPLTNGQDKNLGRPILTRGSVAERVLMFEKCPDVRTAFHNIKRPEPADVPPKALLKVKLHSTPPIQLDQNALQREIRAGKSVYIPRFYFPHGKPQPQIAIERTLRGILSAFDSFPNNQVTKDELKRILKLCGLPFYWRMPVMVFCQQNHSQGLVERQRYVEFWKQMNVYCHDNASRFVYILSRGQRFRSHILPEDLAPLVQDVVDTHPGLAFLKEATEFHSRYVHTVIARIFYSVNRSWSGRISISELKKSDLLEIITLLEEEDDINQIMAFFSYEHFYVIYCKFWELDRDHDLLINQDDLARHSDHALSTRIVERIFSGCVTRSDHRKDPDDEPKMSYTDFVWFLLSEEDKRTPTAIEYWFRCMDVDGDGVLSMYELEYFYEEQQQRMESIGIETLPFEDCLCQMLDMIKPQQRDCVTLGDLKRCKMTHVFFDTFFNLEKYLDHEQRDPFASQRDEYSSDWDRFAAQEYELLITEEND